MEGLQVGEADGWHMAQGKAARFLKLFSTNGMYWACVAVYSPFLSGYFTRMGFTATEIGLLVATLPICSICTQPFITAAADRLGARKFALVALSVVSALLALLYYAVDTFAGMLAICFLFNAIFQSLLPLCDALVVEASELFGLDFARVRMGGTVFYMLFVTVAGVVFEDVPEAQFIGLAATIALFSIVATFLPQPWRTKPDVAKAGEPEPKAHRGKGVLSIFTTRQIVLVLGLAFICYVGAAFHSTFLGRWVVELGYGQDLVGVICAVSAATEIPILLVINRVLERFGELKVLVVSCLAMALRLALVGSGSMPVLMAAQLLQCVSFMTMSYACITYVANHTYEDTKARGQSVLVMIQSGFATVVANVFGGMLCDALGTGTGFVLTGTAMVAATVVVFAANRRQIV
jgi:PPP family 3-phenylpropionic acid transporter